MMSTGEPATTYHPHNRTLQCEEFEVSTPYSGWGGIEPPTHPFFGRSAQPSARSSGDNVCFWPRKLPPETTFDLRYA